MSYKFQAPTQDKTWLAQLHEWADFNKVRLEWQDATVRTGGIATLTSYPIIQGRHYSQFSGEGSKQKISRGNAAEMIIRSPRVL
ncbi:hypothetical protein FRC12_009903, partial [Ceratobasidium sp. 428]